jgi:hypothetical protein
MSRESPREQDVGFERDADDLLVAGRRHLKPRQLALGATDQGGLLGACI